MKTNIWNKELTLPQQILFYVIGGILILGIIITIAYFIGDNKFKSQGYETSDLVITNYLEGIEKTDGSKLRNCFSYYTLHNNELFQQQLNIAKENRSKMKIDTDSITINAVAYPIEDIINNLRNPYITNANLVDVSLEMEKITDYLDCEQFAYYKFITYEFDSEWYIYAVQKINEITDSAKHKKTNQAISIIENSEINLADTQKVGTQKIGYILIDKNWTETDDSKTDNLDTIKSYSNKDGTAIMTISVTTNYESLADFTQKITDNILNTHSDVAKSDIFRTQADFCGYEAVQVFYITDTDPHNMTWAFKINESSNEIYIISYNYSANQSNGANYAYTYTKT